MISPSHYPTKAVLKRHIVKRFILLLFLVIASLIATCDLSAQSYWDAIFKLGYEPITQKVDYALACRRIEDIHRFRQLISQHLTADQDLLNKIRDLDSRITSLDVSNVYDFLPYSDADGVWRAIGIRGQSDLNVYRLDVFDPNIEGWLNFSNADDTSITGSRDHFGDMGFGIFIRPVRKDTFQLIAGAQLNLDDIPAANIMRVVDAILATTWTYAGGAANQSIGAIKKSALYRPNEEVLKGISIDFPNLFWIITQYCDIESIISPNKPNNRDSLGFNIRVRLIPEAFSRQYPQFGKLLKSWREVVKFKARIFDKDGDLMGVVSLDSKKNLFTLQFRTSSDRFLPMQQDRTLKRNNGFSLTAEGSSQFRIDCDFHLNIVGMQIKIDALPVLLAYRQSDGGPHLKAHLAQVPQKINASGSVYGVIPVWLVDLLIPSNVQDIMDVFFQTLTTGDDGNGSLLRIYSISQQASKQSVFLETDAAVLANGTIKMGFNLQRKFFAVPPQLLVEIRTFKNQLWNAFYHDYRRFIRTSGFCSPYNGS